MSRAGVLSAGQPAGVAEEKAPTAAAAGSERCSPLCVPSVERLPRYRSSPAAIDQFIAPTATRHVALALADTNAGQAEVEADAATKGSIGPRALSAQIKGWRIRHPFGSIRI